MSMVSEIAERRLKRLLKLEETNTDIEQFVKQGDVAFEQGDFFEAGECYITAIEKYGPRSVLLTNLGMCYNKAGRYIEAEEVATVALEYDPRSIRARLVRAIARQYLRFYKPAIKDCESILAQIPGDDLIQDQIQSLQASVNNKQGFTMDEEDEEYPLYTAEPWEIVEDLDDDKSKGDEGYNSDTKTCPAYNRGSCDKGKDCELKHGADIRSVKDELGRNVCSALLMGECTEDSCAYSHCTAYLPSRGWWSSEEGIKAAKNLSRYVGEYSYPEYEDLHAAVQQNPKASGYAWADLKAEMIVHFSNQFQDIRPYNKEDYPDEEPGYDWSSDEETYMTPFMAALHPELPKGGDQMPPNKPFVLVVAFQYEDDDLNQSLYDDIGRKVTIIHPRKFTGSLEMTERFLDSPNITGVLLTDPDLFSKREYTVLMHKLVDYVKQGGFLVVGGDIANHLSSGGFDKHMKHTFGLSWTYGDYNGNSFFLNPANELAQRNPSLDKSCDMKTLQIAHVQPEQAVFLHTADSRWPKEEGVTDMEQSPAVCARIGRGLFSFIGDVNCETSSRKTTLAMLGILDQPNILTENA